MYTHDMKCDKCIFRGNWFLILEFSFRFVYVYKIYSQTAENRSHNLFHGVGLGGGGLPPEPALGC